MAFISQADLEHALSVLGLARALDDNHDGEVDLGPLQDFLEDACGHIWAVIYGFNAEVPTSAPRELRRLAAEYAVGRLALRHPEYFRIDGHKLLERVEKELLSIRGTEPAENPAYIVTSPKRGW